MKMKKYIYMAAALATLALGGCEDMLDTENYTQSNTANYPATFEDAEMLLTSVYANLNHMSWKPESSFYMTSEFAGDDCFGGGSGVGSNQAMDHMMLFSDTDFDFVWQMHYKGIFNANTAIEGLLGMQEGVEDTERFNQMLGGYILGPYVEEYYRGNNDKFHKEVADVDDRLMMVMNLRRGLPLKVFPVTSQGVTTWYAPTDGMADTLVDGPRRKYIQNVFSLIYGEVLAGRYASVDAVLDKMLKYQRLNAGASLPSPLQVKAERAYNAVPFATVLFMLNLTLGALLVAFAVWRLIKNGGSEAGEGNEVKAVKAVRAAGLAASVLSLLALTACIALRWIAGGRVPMANGYETMLVMAWFVMVLGLAVYGRFRIALPFSLLMSGFFLLVSHISLMDPQITHVMPVLSSPLLGVHVSVIMMSFALLSLAFAVGVTALLLRLVKRPARPSADDCCERLALLSRLLLYPALALLGVGVFVGAVWANVSWGAYWSWDAKEVWGLITLMVYAVAVHDRSLPFLRRPTGYHLYVTLAFLTILMTYFGVNYFLGGMHSYA